MAIYRVKNGPMQTTAAFVGQTLAATTIKTLLQAKLGGSTNMVGTVVEWGISFDASAAAVPWKVELIDTGTVGATITEFVAADIENLTDPNAAAVTDDFPFAFTAAGDESGYNATAEGTITAIRNLAPPQFIAPTTQYQFQLPLGREPRFKAANFVRIRVTPSSATSTNFYCYMDIEV